MRGIQCRYIPALEPVHPSLESFLLSNVPFLAVPFDVRLKTLLFQT